MLSAIELKNTVQHVDTERGQDSLEPVPAAGKDETGKCDAGESKQPVKLRDVRLLVGNIDS